MRKIGLRTESGFLPILDGHKTKFKNSQFLFHLTTLEMDMGKNIMLLTT